MSKKNLCIIQARMGATRFPGKVLKKVNGLTLLEYEINRVKQAKKIDHRPGGTGKIVIATTNKKADDEIEKLCKQIKIDCFRGSEDDVLDRYYQCSLDYPEYKNIIRITGDCPLIDPVVINEVIKIFEKGKYDYVSNVEKETFPDGMDVEIFKKSVLHSAAKSAKLASQREHVTLFISQNKNFKIGNLSAPKDYSHFRLTVDEPADFEVIKFLIKNSRTNVSYLDYITLLLKNPKIMSKNMDIKRNEGLMKSLREDKIFK